MTTLIEASEAQGLLSEVFQAGRMTSSEKRMLQSILALRGDYNGLIDGDWGRRSETALRHAVDKDFGGGDPLNWQIASMLFDFLDAVDENGWSIRPVAPLAIAMWFPEKLLILRDRDGAFEEWRSADDRVSVSFLDLQDYEVVEAHSHLFGMSGQSKEPYTVRGNTRWVTSVVTPYVTGYLRSDLIAGTWSTVLIFTDAGMKGEMALMSGSIRAGRGYDVVPPDRGYLMQSFEAYLSALAEINVEKEPVARPDQGRAPEVAAEGSSGTAFYVTSDAIALTNAHVVEGCDRISLDRNPARILAMSSAFDLAALQRVDQKRTAFLAFAPEDVRLNADVTIAGYPLHGLLGGINISRGSVSSLKGLHGDEMTIQISAPVQPGNSGGPMVDKFGNVVGVVVSKLNAKAIAEVTGDIAQNVNFAIRGSIAQVFLSANSVHYDFGGVEQALGPEDAASKLEAATVLVECN